MKQEPGVAPALGKALAEKEIDSINRYVEGVWGKLPKVRQAT